MSITVTISMATNHGTTHVSLVKATGGQGIGIQELVLCDMLHPVSDLHTSQMMPFLWTIITCVIQLVEVILENTPTNSMEGDTLT